MSKPLNLDSSTFAHSTFTARAAPVPRWMRMQRHCGSAKSTEPAPVATPPCDHDFDSDVPPCSRRKTVSGSVVTVATHVAHATPDHAAMLPPPPPRFDANTVAEFGRSLTSFMSPLSESLAAFARKSAKLVVWVDAAPEFLKHGASCFAASKTGRGAAGSNLKTQAAAAALIGLLFVFANIPAAAGFYGFATVIPQDAIFHPAALSPWSSPALFLLPDSTFLTNDPRCFTLPHQFTQSGMLSSAESFSTAPNIFLATAALSVRVMTILSPPAIPHPDAFMGGKPLPLISAQPIERRHALNPSTSTFVPNHVFGAIFILVAAVVRHAMQVVRLCSANKLMSRHMSFGRPHRSVAVSVISVFLCCASCLHGVAAADTAVSVDPVTGQNVPNCGQTPPCRTIEYAVRTRLATSVLLSEGIFHEINIYVESIAPHFSVSGSRNNTTFDCGRRGPAFIIANSSVAIAGVTFQNCVNFNASGTGGAISAHSSSVVAVTNCAFYNNTAQTGGAIGAISSTLTVTSSLFENNTATCPNAFAACSAWGGAIGAVEVQSVTIAGNRFNRNAVNLQLNGVRDGSSSAAGGGGCVSVLYNADVSNSRVAMDGNNFQSCSVRVSPTATSGVQYGNAYGGAVSVYYGLRAASLLQVRNVASSFTNNLCRGSVVNARVGVGGSVFGGCLSIYAGPTTVSNSSYTISSNTLTNCTASSLTSGDFDSSSAGASVYGGGISIAVGAYSYSQGGSSTVSGPTTVSISSYTISSNTLTSCTALTSLTSFEYSSSYGANAYGGGISVAVGAYSYSREGSSTVSGPTTVSSSSYTISSNTLTSCTASSLKSGPSESLSAGASVYGGGISVAVGAYSYSLGVSSTVSGNTTVSSSSYTVSSNTLTNCTALPLTTGKSSSYGSNAYGGGISVAVGAFLLRYSFSGEGFSTVSGPTTVSNSSYTISSNTLTNCTASSLTSGLSSSSSSSAGANAYGGGISVAVGAYSYSREGSSTVSGPTTVSSSSYTISSNTLTSCTASSLTSGLSSVSTSSSAGASVYGGGISVAVGAYSYSRVGSSNVSGLLISSCTFELFKVSCAHCSSNSSTSGFSNEAFSFGGAVSASFESYAYPRSSTTSVAVTLSSNFMFLSCNFSISIASSSSSSCSPGGSSAAGGAVFVSVGSADVAISSSVVSDSHVQTRCAAPSSQTHSLGGGVSIFRAGNVVLNVTNVTFCRASGVRQAINVLVGGGGIFVQDAESVALQSSFVSACSIDDAFSVRVLPCGGGAIGITNVPAVQISSSKVYNNSDSSLSGAILLQQLNEQAGMVVNITNGSFLSSDPSISLLLPVLKISCGSNCSVEQQQRVRLNVMDSTILAETPSDQRYPSAAVMVLPRRSKLSAVNSYLRCNFSGLGSIAALSRSDADQMLVTCAPCEKPFHVARTSQSTMNLSSFSAFAAETEAGDSCRPISKSTGLQSCPYGISTCSTVTDITVGFWTSFAADGSVGNATRCPSNYCGCRNDLSYANSTCQLYPPFAVEYQPDDALCSGNRTGKLCGGCKQNFTQSLNGHSCVHNEICSKTMPLVWTVTVVGYFVYAVYILITSMQTSSGLITCVLFYGQLSSFASLPSQFVDDSEKSELSAWFSKVAQFSSIMSLYDKSCYGLDMGAYEATAAQLCGPAIVLSATLLLTAAAKRLLLRVANFLQKHNFDVEISFGATMINVLLLLFSSVSSVIFQLITCQEVGLENVVFIDGTRKCEGHLHNVLVAVAVLLSVIPAAFWALLKFNKIPAALKAIVCSAYSNSRYYWGAASLLFRFLMTVIFSTSRHFPSITALALLICTVFMFAFLIMLRPYVEQRTYYMDIFCYICLIVQFALQGIVRASESLGVAVTEANSFHPVLRDAARASNALRCVCLHLFSCVRQ
jgi:hypothetical protein